jgi:hypothetical protein
MGGPALAGLARQLAALEVQLQSFLAADNDPAKTLLSNSQVAALLRTQVQQLTASLASLKQAFSVLQI